MSSEAKRQWLDRISPWLSIFADIIRGEKVVASKFALMIESRCFCSLACCLGGSASHLCPLLTVASTAGLLSPMARVPVFEVAGFIAFLSIHTCG